ncbi:MAG: hypothetical protein ABR587_15040, partial [Candidatus Binatia bacterium]
MHSNDRRSGQKLRALWPALATAFLMVGALAIPAAAQDMMQLTVPAPEYTLGRFKYEAPKTDGWRQLANYQQGLSLVYAEQKDEDTIETRFGVAFEVHEIPENIQVESASGLADLSRRQMAETRKSDLVALSGIEAVPSIENMYTYRLLVRSPVPDMPEAYEVYYVVMAPDKSQYIVIQCITKSQTYADEIYFTQFYGSLTTLKYTPPAEGEKGSGDPAKP